MQIIENVSKEAEFDHIIKVTASEEKKIDDIEFIRVPCSNDPLLEKFDKYYSKK